MKRTQPDRTTHLNATVAEPLKDWRVVHDFGYVAGGAERVSALLAQEVAVGDQLLVLGGHSEVFQGLGLPGIASFDLPFLTPRNYRALSLTVPLVARFRPPLEGNVVASSYAFAHHIRTTGKKLVYCHTPLRHIWSGTRMYAKSLPAPMRPVAAACTGTLRAVDRQAAGGAAAYVANSKAVARRIRQFYDIDPMAVVHPPFSRQFRLGSEQRDDHYLWVGRIVEPYKRLEPVIEAFRERPSRRLVVIGEGRDAARLRHEAPPNVTFAGAMNTDELAVEYRRARAVIFPSEDDFGLVPIEAMASGTPVIAVALGGALETVVAGASGVFFPEATPGHISAAIDSFESTDAWRPETIRSYAVKAFGQEHFVHTMREILSSL